MAEPVLFSGILDFTSIRVILALAMFASASYFDLKKREVSDLLWIVFAAAAGVLYIFDFPTSFSEGLMIIVSMGITAAAAYGIYRSGLFGGADMLALITLSAILPVYQGSLFGIKGVSLHGLAPLIVLTNAVILSVAQVIFNVLRNLVYYSKHSGKLFEGLHDEPASRKFFAMVIGHRSQNPQFAFPIEKVVGGKREFDFALRDAETAEYESKKDVWVTSGTPFLLYFFAGFIAMIATGDLLILAFKAAGFTVH